MYLEIDQPGVCDSSDEEGCAMLFAEAVEAHAGRPQ
jgi:hypothetical protein